MKLTIPQPQLAALIARGAVATGDAKSPIPILYFCRIVANGDGSIAVASTDQDRFAEAIGVAAVSEAGGACVDAKAFATLIGKHPKNGTIGLELDGQRLIVTCGRSKVKLPTLPAEQFPNWADEASVASFKLSGSDFKQALLRVRFAASNDESRWYLQGVHFDAHDGSLHFVATDGHRLAVSGMKMPDGAQDCPPVIVPSEAIDAALKVFDGAAEILLTVNAKAIGFAADGLRLSSRLIEGTYPDYTRIIPERGNPSLTIKRADFVDCLDRANVLTGDGAFSAITARPDGDTLFLESRNQMGGEANEELPATIDERFRPFGFNPRYAAAFLATLSVSTLTIEQSAPNEPHLIYSDDAPDFIGVLSPMMVAA